MNIEHFSLNLMGREIGFETVLRSGPIIPCAVEFYLLQGLISSEIL